MPIYQDRWHEPANPSIGYGVHSWPNIDVLAKDAASASYYKERCKTLEWLIGGISIKGPMRIRHLDVVSHLRYTLHIDEPTGDYILDLEQPK